MKKDNKDFWSTFKYNYNNLEGFDSLIKIVAFFGLSIIFLLIARISINSDRKVANTTTTTSISQKQDRINSKIKDIIKKEATIKITSDTTKIQISSLKEENGEITGFYQDVNSSKKFKIKEDKVYELVFDDEVENEELLKDVNFDFLIPSMLVGTINESIYKSENNEINKTYTYQYTKDEITYEINVTMTSKEVQTITIDDTLTKYEITYK